jgi:hypothetical protein
MTASDPPHKHPKNGIFGIPMQYLQIFRMYGIIPRVVK